MPRFVPALGTVAVIVVAAALALNVFVRQPGLVGTEDPSPKPTADFMWPQSSLEAVREAQQLADAGDPGYTWQVDPELWDWHSASLDASLGDAQIVNRFLREELGWEEYRYNPIPEDGFGDGLHGNAAYIRCAPGRANPLFPKDPEGSSCAPTIDELRYERVSLDLAQLARRDPTGIWVITRWAMIQPFEQAHPPSDAEIATLLDAFLQARIDGEGAERYVGVPEYDLPTTDVPDVEVPLLYATTNAARYERSEFELIDGPGWPDGSMQFKVRLFAENGETVVEQYFSLQRGEAGRLGLAYDFEPIGPEGPVPGTTENGHVVPVDYSFLGGEVAFHAAYPWEPSSEVEDHSPTKTALLGDGAYDERLLLLADPRPIGTDCQEGPAPTDAEALARSLQSDPDLEVTAPVPVGVGGASALQMDVVVATGTRDCTWQAPGVVGTSPLVLAEMPLIGGERMRLYLLDLPGDSGRVLAIAIIASDERFEAALEAAAPIVDSIEFHTQ